VRKPVIFLQELRRGTENHFILSLAFNATSDWIACTSDTGTVHVFRVGDNEKKEG